MPKVKFNKLIDSLSGRIGNVILYQADGQTLSRTAPKAAPAQTGKQRANSSRFQAR